MDTQKVDTDALTYIYGCLVARPSEIVVRENLIYVYSDPIGDELGKTFQKIDRVDWYNALLTTHVVAGANKRWAEASDFRTAISNLDGFTFYIEDRDSIINAFVENIQLTRIDPLLTPVAALMLHRQMEPQSGSCEDRHG